MAQKTLFIVCLVAGVVAMVSAQSFDWQSCSKSVRYQADRSREDLMKAAQKFTSNLQQTAGQAMDTSSFQSDIDKLTQSFASMADMSQNLDMGRITSMYLENMQTMASLARSAFRMYLVSGTMDNYIEFGNSLMTVNTQFMQSVTQACMPASRVKPTSNTVV